MKKVKRNLKDLVAASYVAHTNNDSPYANLRHKLSPRKLQEFINALTENEKADYFVYCESSHGKRELREYEAKERRAARERALIRKNRIFSERFSKLTLKAAKTEELRKRLDQAKSLSLDEIAQSLIIFPELLPAGHKAPALTLARKHLKAILLDKEKEYLMYVWADTSIPVEVCYSNIGGSRGMSAELS
ncbi:MAG: hypothetical protein NDI69_01490 [Bacteriovoracaceae bacterium]|nr:hypothetical protein [Bacteriovoracaceae bacterium]